MTDMGKIYALITHCHHVTLSYVHIGQQKIQMKEKIACFREMIVQYEDKT